MTKPSMGGHDILLLALFSAESEHDELVIFRARAVNAVSTTEEPQFKDLLFDVDRL